MDYRVLEASDWLKGTEDLFAPPSPAVSRQWTYRDGKLVNLPVGVLLEGDIISLRPGIEAPTELRGIQVSAHKQVKILKFGDILVFIIYRLISFYIVLET